jgi:hypothetical protein
MQRDVRIDIVRGLGVLMIALDHLAGAVDRLLPDRFIVPFVTWSRLGWSSAAEFFVFFSGFLVGLVYSRTLAARGPLLMQMRAVHRAWEIYAANVLTALFVMLLLYATPLGGNGLVESAYFARLVESSGAGWVAFLTMQQAPMFFEILQLYVVLLLVAPLFLLLARTNVWGALGVSFLVWLTVQIAPAALHVPNWTFNPFAWQFVFVLGMLCSTQRVFERIETSPRRRMLFVLSVGFVACALLLKIVEKTGIEIPLLGTLAVSGIDKMTLGPLRLVHFLLSVVVIMQLLPRSGRALTTLPARSIAKIGKRSLECFCMSTILVYLGCGSMLATNRVTTFNVAASGLALIVLLCAFAALVDWIRSEPWRGGGPDSSRKGVDSADQLRNSALPAGSMHLRAS